MNKSINEDLRSLLTFLAVHICKSWDASTSTNPARTRKNHASVTTLLPKELLPKSHLSLAHFNGFLPQQFSDLGSWHFVDVTMHSLSIWTWGHLSLLMDAICVCSCFKQIGDEGSFALATHGILQLRAVFRICLASLPTWWMTWAQHASFEKPWSLWGPKQRQVSWLLLRLFAHAHFCSTSSIASSDMTIIKDTYTHRLARGNALSQRLKTRNKTALGRAGFLIQWDHNGTKRHPPYVRCKNKGTCFHLGVRMMTWCPPRHQLEIPPRSWLIGIFCASCISVPAALVIRSESKE